MVMYNTKGLFNFSTFSTVWYAIKINFGNWICFRPQVQGWEKSTLLTPSEGPNLNHWTSTQQHRRAIICIKLQL
jgi:hypothetical protein